MNYLLQATGMHAVAGLMNGAGILMIDNGIKENDVKFIGMGSFFLAAGVLSRGISEGMQATCIARPGYCAQFFSINIVNLSSFDLSATTIKNCHIAGVLVALAMNIYPYAINILFPPEREIEVF